MLSLNTTEILSAFVVQFALIDALGSVPLFINFKKADREIHPLQASVYSFLLLTGFLFIGEWVLRLFNVDITSFAVAGSLVIFFISFEMIFGIEVFKNDAPGGSITLVPVAFPLIAGPGTFTALLSMRAEYHTINIIAALLFNMGIVYLVLKHLHLAHRMIGVDGVYVMRKFFGIILMAIAVRLFTANVSTLI